MKKQKINGLVALVLVIVSIIMTSSLLQGNFVIFSRGWVWLALGCVICVLQYPSYLRQKSITWLLIYALIVFLNYFTGDLYFNSPVNVIMEIGMLLFCSYTSYYASERDNYLTNFLVGGLLIVIVLTSVLSITVDMVFPGVIRETVSMINGGYSDEAIPFYRMGVCEYGFPHAVPMIIPGIVLLSKNREIKLFYRIIAIVLLCLLFYLVFVSGVTTALILVLFGILSSLFVREGELKKNVSRLIILGVLLTPLLSDNVMLGILNFAEQVVPEKNKITGKIINFEETIKNDDAADGSIQQRGDLYGMSLDAFLSNPIIGTNDKPLGGHSAFLDRMGTLGLLGFVPFILFTFLLIKQIKQRIHKHAVIFYYIGMAGFLVMLSSKNMSNIYVWLYSICLLPALIQLNSNPPKFLLRH